MASDAGNHSFVSIISRYTGQEVGVTNNPPYSLNYNPLDPSQSPSIQGKDNNQANVRKSKVEPSHSTVESQAPSTGNRSSIDMNTRDGNMMEDTISALSLPSNVSVMSETSTINS